MINIQDGSVFKLAMIYTQLDKQIKDQFNDPCYSLYRSHRPSLYFYYKKVLQEKCNQELKSKK
jgi:hypothetical protein